MNFPRDALGQTLDRLGQNALGWKLISKDTRSVGFFLPEPKSLAILKPET